MNAFSSKSRESRRSIQNRARNRAAWLAIALTAAGVARATICPQDASPCAYLCDDDSNPETPPTPAAAAPINVLYLGGSAFPAWLSTALTTTSGDCSACAMSAGVQFRPYAVTWAAARGWTAEQYRAFDVIVVDGAAASAFSAVAPLNAGDSWLTAFRTARRVVVTGLALPAASGSMNAFREFSQNAVAWLSRDECCLLPSGLGVSPGIFIADDRSPDPFAYSPWHGLARAYFGGARAQSGCPSGPGLIIKLDDVIVPACHAVLAGTRDTAVAGCAGNNACSFDRAGPSAAALWRAGIAAIPGETCGYEEHGFAAIQTVLVASSSGCTYGPPCPGFSGTDVTLVRDRGCATELLPAAPDTTGMACAHP